MTGLPQPASGRLSNEKRMATKTGILSRYALVLDTLADASRGLTLTEIMRVTGLPRGTLHRLISALLEVGYIEPVGGRKVYILGTRLLRTLHSGTSTRTVATQVQPLLEDLVAKFGETAFAAKLIGTEVAAVAMVVPETQTRSYVQPGREMPIHAAASAKAIFAFQDGELVDKVLRQPRIQYTDKAHTGEDEIRAELAAIRRDGFAICDEELDPHVYSYACPVYLDGAGVIYSVGLVGLSERLLKFPVEKIVAALRDSADEFASLVSH